MSRRPKAELQFGSDSFLDVVANIVGILIILIVLAGLRVSKMPVVITSPEAESPSETEAIAPAEMVAEPAPLIEEAKPAVAMVQPSPQLAPETIEEPEEVDEPLPALPPLVVPSELVDRANQLEGELAEIQLTEAELAERLKQSRQQQSSLLEKQQAMRNVLVEKKRDLTVSQKKSAALEADLDLARETLIRLTRQVEEIQAQPAPVETLEHKITPISKVVMGKEKHYRLEKNRVAEVPIDELVGRFREQIERRRDWLAKTRQHQGEIGPIQGFTMKYIVRVDSTSELDAARIGYGGFRVSLSQWEVRPEKGFKGEAADVALKKGSKFYDSLLGVTPETTLTFWVYPDSYELYRKLQKFTQQHGFSVAARPLPEGVPLAGSPNGSRSASQ